MNKTMRDLRFSQR